jgi:hypothetical protein
LTQFLGSDHRAVTVAINLATKYGLLVNGSGRRCLQIPLNQFETCATGVTIDKQKAQRFVPCPTCTSKPRRPALCHPNKERYNSIEAGGLCENCYRRVLRGGSVMPDTESVDGDEGLRIACRPRGARP